MSGGSQWPLKRLDPVLFEQDGYFTTAQAAQVGVSPPKIDRMLKAKRVRRVQHGVYQITQNPPLPRVDERIYAPWLALDAKRLPWERSEPVIVASHETAANLHGIGTLPDDQEIHFTSIKRRRTNQVGVKIHTAPLTSEDWVWLKERHIMATSAARTIVDYARANKEQNYVERAAYDALSMALLDTEELISMITRFKSAKTEPLLAWALQL